GPFGLITDDTRHLSRLQVRLDSEPLRHLGSGLISPAVARFRCYATLSNRLPDAPVECRAAARAVARRHGGDAGRRSAGFAVPATRTATA
ncbi:MAG: glycogen debranching N-terminal domain-containing protein, partial [Pseudonocardiaceae bacterium]